MVILIINGCASALKQDTSGLSELVVLGGGVSGFFKGALLPYSIQKETSVELIDGEKKKKAKSRTYYLEPGNHIVKVECTIIFGKNPISSNGEKEIAINFKPGVKYVVDADLGGREPPHRLSWEVPPCIPRIEIEENT